MIKRIEQGKVFPFELIAKHIDRNKEVSGYNKSEDSVHVIPVVGGVIGGGLTFMSFKPCVEDN